jgi:hypothetical protein
LLASACAANDQTEARTAPEIDMIQLRDFISNSLHGWCVMHGSTRASRADGLGQSSTAPPGCPARGRA